MSNNDKHRFIEAFVTVSTHPEWKFRFVALARIHFENFRGKKIHNRHEFLPWHRWYVLSPTRTKIFFDKFPSVQRLRFGSCDLDSIRVTIFATSDMVNFHSSRIESITL